MKALIMLIISSLASIVVTALSKVITGNLTDEKGTSLHFATVPVFSTEYTGKTAGQATTSA